MTPTELIDLLVEAQMLVEESAGVFGWKPTMKKTEAFANLVAAKVLAQPEQKPVAMKFKIYKPTVPDPMRQGINNALLPWVYDQDRSSGFDASMWVTPVATLPPQRTWVGLTNNDLQPIAEEYRILFGSWVHDFARAIEAKLKEKNT